MKSLFTLNKYLWKYRGRLFLGFILVFLTNLTSIYSLNYVRKGLNTLAEIYTGFNDKAVDLSDLKNTLLQTVLLFVGFTLLAAALNMGVRLSIIVASRHIEYDLKNEIYKQYQRLSLSFYKKNKTGDLMNRISEDVAFVRMYLGPGIMNPINLLAAIIILPTFMLQIDYKLTFYTLLPLPVLSLIIYKVSSVVNKKSRILQAQQSQISSTIQDIFSGIRVVKSFNTEKTMELSYEKEAGDYERKALSLAQTEAFFSPLMILVIGVSNLLILYVGGLRFIEGALDIGAVGLFFMYLNKLIWPFTSLGWVTMIIKRAEASMFRINEFLKEKPEIKNLVENETPIKGKIEFRNVSFTYENTGIQALKNISFVIEKGKSLAILGRAGSGKSTIALLLARMLEPDSGEILIDDIPYKQINLYSLRDSIGYVPQEAFLFSESIASNILYGSADKDLQKAKTYADKAAVSDNIEEFKDKYETILGERGVTLSGGQKQRISIARALIKNPNILVFDDSLSAVDTETEDKILRNLENEFNKKTTLIITHRVSSAKNADAILILDQGKISEIGTHKELMKEEGYYFNLHQKQLVRHD